MSNTADTATTPSAKAKILALTITYLKALQDSPGLTEEEFAEAENLKTRIATELK